MNFNHFFEESEISLTTVAKAMGISRQSLGQKVSNLNRQFLTYLDKDSIIDYLKELNCKLEEAIKEYEITLFFSIDELRRIYSRNSNFLKNMNQKTIIIEQRPSTLDEKVCIIEFNIHKMKIENLLLPFGDVAKSFNEENIRRDFNDQCSFFTSVVEGFNFKFVDLSKYCFGEKGKLDLFHLKFLLDEKDSVADLENKNNIEQDFEGNLSSKDELINLIIKKGSKERIAFLFSELKQEYKTVAKENKMGKDYIQYLDNLSIDCI